MLTDTPPKVKVSERFNAISFCRSARLTAGMELLMNRLEAVFVDMRINLSRRDIRMSQKFLDDTEVRAALQQMSRERMPERMGRNLFLNSRKTGVFLDNPP